MTNDQAPMTNEKTMTNVQWLRDLRLRRLALVIAAKSYEEKP